MYLHVFISRNDFFRFPYLKKEFFIYFRREGKILKIPSAVFFYDPLFLIFHSEKRKKKKGYFHFLLKGKMKNDLKEKDYALY